MTSPTAYSQGSPPEPRDLHAVGDADVARSSAQRRPTRARGRGGRRAPDRHEQLVGGTLRRRRAVTVTSPVGPSRDTERRRCPGARRHRRAPGPRRPPRRRTPRCARAAVGQLDDGDRRPDRRVDLGHLAGHHAAPEDGQPVGDPCGSWSPRGWSTASPRAGRGSAGTAAIVPVARMTACRAAVGLPSTSTASSPVEPGLAAQQRDADVVEPADLAAVVEGVAGADPVDPRVPPSQHTLRVDVGALGSLHALGGPGGVDRAQQGLARRAGVEAALATDEVLLHDRDGEAGLVRAVGGVLTDRAGADHDDVELLGRRAAGQVLFGHALNVDGA